MIQRNGKTQILGEQSCFTPQLREKKNAQRKKAVKKNHAEGHRN